MAETGPLSMWEQEEDDEKEDAEEDVLISVAASLASIAKTLKSINASLRSLVETTTEEATPPWLRKNKEKKSSPTVKRKGPPCPECDTPLVERQGSRGPFWGCPKYPKCRGTRDIKPREYVNDSLDHGDIPNTDEFEEGPF